MTNESSPPVAVGSNDGLGPFAELHNPETEFEDGTWHKPLPQGWSGGTLVYTETQMLARVAAERERCAKAAEDYLTRGRSPLGRAVADAIRKA